MFALRDSQCKVAGVQRLEALGSGTQTMLGTLTRMVAMETLLP